LREYIALEIPLDKDFQALEDLVTAEKEKKEKKVVDKRTAPAGAGR